MKRRTIISLAGTIFILAGCSIAPPEIRLTGEKTLVENQIIGEYREIEEDAWAVSSIQTGVQRQQGLQVVSGDEALVRAMKVREFNQDALRRYKDDGVVGEGNNGFVSYVQVRKYESDRDAKKLLLNVIDDENKARQTVFERSLVAVGKETPTPDEVSALAKRFAQDEQSRSLKNDWIQGSNGQWIRKK